MSWTLRRKFDSSRGAPRRRLPGNKLFPRSSTLGIEKGNKNDLDISHFQCSLQIIFRYPGATRFAALSACPWLSYSAPLALLRESFAQMVESNRRAPKARNMIARGKRRATRGASPLE